MSAALNYSHPWGGPLTESDYQSLAARWITPELADQCGIRRVDSITGGEMFGRKRGNLAGLIIPNVAPWDSHPRNYRLRLDHPDLQYRSDGTVREANKYLQAPDARNTLYFPLGVSEAALTDTTLPIIIVEGEFKSIALWRLATHQTDSPRFLPIAVSGVWNWRGVVGKHIGPNGDRRDVKGLIPDLGRIGWKGRRVIIAFDADSETNESVRAARSQLTGNLLEPGATVGFLEWPADQGKGIDDRLAAIGPERVLADIAAIEYGGWRTRLLLNDSGKIRATYENAALFLQNDPAWAGVLGFNEFTGGQYVLRHPPAPVSAVPGAELEDHFDTEVVRWLERRGVLVKPDLVRRVIDSVARRNSFHPVRQYLDSLKWDGQPRVRTWLIDYCGVSANSDADHYVTAIGERFLISAVARIFEPGCKVDHMLVLEGPQGVGKSSVARTLAGKEWFSDQLADLGSKDASMQLRGVWMVELSELASMNRVELERQKAFITQQSERFRLPYGSRIVEIPRQCLFIGTTNTDTWLKDETGGRRFWPVRCGSQIDLERLARDRDQLWAEAVVRYQDGIPWWLDDQEVIEQAKEEQRARFQEDPWAQDVVKYAERESECRGSVSVQDILKCLGIEQGRWDQAAATRVGRCLKAAGWKRCRQRINGEPEWRYRRVSEP
jgi:predicted P-loop ATPase